LKGPKGACAGANVFAYSVELRRARHFAWLNCGHEQTTKSCLARIPNAMLIADYAAAFFNRHLKGLAEPLFVKNNPALADYAFRLERERFAPPPPFPSAATVLPIIAIRDSDANLQHRLINPLYPC
jgi:hypothetical protein